MFSLKKFFEKIKAPRVYALVGESGTGKSYRAQLLAQEYDIALIIDDGLLIEGDRILAGKSAKLAETILGSLRIALFDNKEHRDEIAKVLQKNKNKKVLILGTSVKMVNKIAIRLQIPQPEKIIYIEDIARTEDIEAAKRSRMIEGKHVIPVASFEVKKHYPQIFHDRITLMLKRKNKSRTEQAEPIEKSLVRPLYSRIEAVQISDEALKEFVTKSVFEFNSEIRLNNINIIHREETKSYIVELTVDIPFDAQVSNKIESLKKFVTERIEKYAAVSIENITVIIDKILVKS
ncbi:MAG: ATP-binding protein [Treponemataceae bacterium]